MIQVELRATQGASLWETTGDTTLTPKGGKKITVDCIDGLSPYTSEDAALVGTIPDITSALADVVSVPAGGDTGEVLKKVSGDDYDLEWGVGGGIGGSADEITVTPAGNIVSEDVQSALEELDGFIGDTSTLETTATDLVGAVNEVKNSGGGSFLDVDVPPITPSAWDDEFNDGTIDASWVNFNLASGTKSEDATALSMIIGAAGSGMSQQGIVKASPTGGFSIMCKLSGGATQAASFRYGLIVAESTTGKNFVFSVLSQNTVIGAALSEVMDDPTNRALYYLTSGIIEAFGSGYLKVDIYNDGGTWKANTFHSKNGIRYYPVHSAIAIGFTPAYTGIAVCSEGVGGINTGYFDWFRVTE